MEMKNERNFKGHGEKKWETNKNLCQNKNLILNGERVVKEIIEIIF